MRDPRPLLASIAASSALVAAATLALLSISAIIAFHGWPVGGDAPGSAIALPAVPAQAVDPPGPILVPTATSPRSLRTGVRRASPSLRRRFTPSAVRRQPSRRSVRTPAPATPATPAAHAMPSAPAPSSAPATPSPSAVPAVVSHVAPASAPAPTPVPAPVAGPADQVAGTAAGAPAPAGDVVAGSPPVAQLAAGDPR